MSAYATSESDLLTTEEAATLSGLTANTIRTQIRRKRLPGFKLGSQWLVRRQDLEHYMQTIARRERNLEGA